jgi:CRISPR-associated protein Cmr2
MSELEQRFICAIAFCLAYEKCGGDVQAIATATREFKALAQWALTHKSSAEDVPAPSDETLKVGLVAGGATKIKGYVFESSRLPEIRGASSLLDRINLTDVPSLFGIPKEKGWEDEDRQMRAQQVRADFHARTQKEAPDFPDCVVYANGGELLAFAPPSLAPLLADEIELIYTRETLVAQSVAVSRNFTLQELRDGLLAGESLDETNEAVIKRLLGYHPVEEHTFGNLVATLALAKFRRREANADDSRDLKLRTLTHLETPSFARRCSSCERRCAVVTFSLADDVRPLCEPCARKRVFGQLTKSGSEKASQWWEKEGFTWQPKAAQSWAQVFREIHRDVKAVEPPDDLSEIGEKSKPAGFIGIVYADGNNMGALLEELRTPAEYHTFAESVYEATKNAVFAALKNNLDHQAGYPFEILSIGGDDFFLIVPAHVALPIACDIAREVEATLRTKSQFIYPEGYEWQNVQRCQQSESDILQPQSKVSLSAGVVIADASTPVFYLADLAEQLLKTAKRRAKWLKRAHHYYGGTVDFLALKSVTMISGRVEEFRQMALTRRVEMRAPRWLSPAVENAQQNTLARLGRRLYARPYTIAEMEALLESARQLKQAEFPRSQLYRLRESLRLSRTRGTVDYHYFLSRDKSLRETREAIESLWNPKQKAALEAAPAPPSNTSTLWRADGQAWLHPWRMRGQEHAKDDDRWETIWYDLIELYDFVSKEEKEYA